MWVYNVVYMKHICKYTYVKNMNTHTSKTFEHAYIKNMNTGVYIHQQHMNIYIHVYIKHTLTYIHLKHLLVYIDQNMRVYMHTHEPRVNVPTRNM